MQFAVQKSSWCKLVVDAVVIGVVEGVGVVESCTVVEKFDKVEAGLLLVVVVNMPGWHVADVVSQ